MRTAILRQLRLLIACLVLAVVARPAGTALEGPRAVAVLVASAEARPAEVVHSRTSARAEQRGPSLRVALAPPPSAVDHVASLHPAGRERGLGSTPLYLVNERFLL